MGCGNSFSTITKDTTRYYCYTTEEIGEIESIINPKSKDAPEFKDEQIIFHKFSTEIKNLKKIIRKEYIHIKKNIPLLVHINILLLLWIAAINWN